MKVRPLEILARIARTFLFLMFRPREIVDWQARVIARTLQKKFSIDSERAPIAVVRGTGWDKTLVMKNLMAVPWDDLWFLRGLEFAPGHSPEFRFGMVTVFDIPIITLARIHLNQERATPGATHMWHAVLKALHLLGIRTLVLTHGMGGFRSAGLNVGDVVVVNEFIPPRDIDVGLFTGQHCSPANVLRRAVCELVQPILKGAGLCARIGVAAYFRGPEFEGSMVKEEMARCGACCATMSGYPEVTVWSSFTDTEKPHRAVSMAVVTNLDFTESGDFVDHQHADNVQAADAQAIRLGQGLTNVIRELWYHH